MFSELDIESWPRRSTYDFFKNYQDPFFNFTANVDITHAFKFARKNKLRWSLTALFCSLSSANTIREFKIRNIGGKLVEFERIHATQTILNEDETFSFAYFDMKDDLFDFERAGREALEKYQALKTLAVERDRFDLIYHSVIPWVSFTSFKHASRLDNQQTVPRVVFGKIYDDGRRKLMPLSVEANHMIMDGIHVGRFFNRFQESLDGLE
ncbi:MAG: CatA-like O-acetyltransferase [Acidobacteriota bacterium]